MHSRFDCLQPRVIANTHIHFTVRKIRYDVGTFAAMNDADAERGAWNSAIEFLHLLDLIRKFKNGIASTLRLNSRVGRDTSYFHAVLTGAASRGDNMIDRSSRLQYDDGVALFGNTLYQRFAARRTDLFIAVADKGDALIICLLVSDEEMETIHPYQDARFHIQHARACGGTRASALTEGKRATLCFTFGEDSIHMPDKQNAWTLRSISFMDGNEIIPVFLLAINRGSEAKIGETFL